MKNTEIGVPVGCIIRYMAVPINSYLDVGEIKIIEGRDLERYMTDFSPEEIFQSRQLWRQYSRRPDLIDFENGRVRQYAYDKKTLKYYEITGGRKREIPIESVKMDVSLFAAKIQDQQRQLMIDMMNGAISPQEWYDQSIRLMKLSYYAVTTVSRGNPGGMSEEEKSRLIWLLLFLFLLLNDTATGIVNGRIKISRRLPVSHGLRGAAIRIIFENWRLTEARRAGYDEARRFLSIAEHCHKSSLPGCVEEAERGWVSIDSVVPLGGCTCRGNCKCYMRYRKSYESKR